MSEALKRLQILVDLLMRHEVERSALLFYKEEEIISKSGRVNTNIKGPLILERIWLTQETIRSRAGNYEEQTVLHCTIKVPNQTPRVFTFSFPLLKGITTMKWYQYQTVYMWRNDQPPLFIVWFQVDKNHSAELAFITTKMPIIWKTLLEDYKFNIIETAQRQEELSFLINTSLLDEYNISNK